MLNIEEIDAEHGNQVVHESRIEDILSAAIMVLACCHVVACVIIDA